MKEGLPNRGRAEEAASQPRIDGGQSCRGRLQSADEWSCRPWRRAVDGRSSRPWMRAAAEFQVRAQGPAALLSSPSPLFPPLSIGAARGRALSSLSPLVSFLCRFALQGPCALEYTRYAHDFPPARVISHPPATPLPSRACDSPFPMRAQVADARFFPRASPSARVASARTPWRRLPARGDAIDWKVVAGGTPRLGARLDALASPRRRHENHGCKKTQEQTIK